MTELTLILRPPEASRAIAASLLAGTYSATAAKPEDSAARAEDLQAVTSFAQEHHLQITKSDPATRTVRLTGSDSDIEKAFALEPGSLAEPNHKIQAVIPPSLKNTVIAILGLDQSPIARHHGQ